MAWNTGGEKSRHLTRNFVGSLTFGVGKLPWWDGAHAAELF
jgi:hypothetical protein